MPNSIGTQLIFVSPRTNQLSHGQFAVAEGWLAILSPVSCDGCVLADADDVASLPLLFEFQFVAGPKTLISWHAISVIASFKIFTRHSYYDVAHGK